MKITLQNKEEIELTDLTDREFQVWLAGIKYGGGHVGKWILITAAIVGFIIVVFTSCASAQATKAVYRQTLIIKSNKPISITWQKITVNYLDEIYQYNSKLNKRRKVLIVFGKEGVSPLSDWIKYEVKEGDTLYNYKRVN